MKEQLTSFDIFCITKELQNSNLAYLEKIYTAVDGNLIFRFSGKKDIELYVCGKYIAASGIEHTQHPDKFAMELRKYVMNKKVDAISQVGFDRILKIDVGEYSLYLEIFGEGNVILTGNGRIITAWKYKKYTQRNIARGEIYRTPPQKISPISLTLDDFRTLCRNAKHDLRRNLVTQLWLGGIAEEILQRAKIEGNMEINALDEGQMEEVFTSIKSVFASANALKPCVVYANNQPLDVVGIELKVYANHTCVPFESFLEAIKVYFMAVQNITEMAEEERKKDALLKKVFRKLEIQKAELENAEKEYEYWRRVGDFIYAHYDELAFQSLKPENEKEKNLIKYGNGELEFYIDRSISLNENAQNAYHKASINREKILRLKKEIEKTEKEIAAISSQKILPQKHTEKKTERRKTFWFENFRWFISSDGFIVVSGYDAASNDRVVKKYLNEKDRYVHANIHGSPSTVIKAEGREIPETTIYEACVFTVAYTKAWSKGVGNLDAYWVKPEQVSKTPQSGEFVPKGAWIIRGAKNFVTGIKPELGIGFIEYQGAKLLMCAPLSAIKKHAEDYFILVPGNREKEEIAKELAGIFDTKIEMLQKLLPPGKTDVIKSKNS